MSQSFDEQGFAILGVAPKVDPDTGKTVFDPITGKPVPDEKLSLITINTYGPNPVRYTARLPDCTPAVHQMLSTSGHAHVKFDRGAQPYIATNVHLQSE